MPEAAIEEAPEVLMPSLITGAVASLDALVESAGINWGDLQLSDEDIDDGNTVAYVKKLNHVAGHLQWVSMELQKAEAELTAINKTLEWVSTKRLAREENDLETRPKGSQAMRLALFIDTTAPLKAAKLRSIELAVRVEALERVKDALDTIWKTTSRALSARIAEPLDR